MDGIIGMSRIVVNVKQLQRWCEDCICSVDCQCNSCVYGCIRSVDCQCHFCFDDCSRKKNEGDNHTEVVLDDLAMDELQKVKNSSATNSEYNEYQMFDECPQWAESEILVELHSTRITSTTETKIMNSHMDSRPYALVIEDTIPKMMGLNNLSSAYNITTHLGYAPLSNSKVDILLGDKLFDIKPEEDILAAFCDPHTTIGLLPHALDLCICNWVDTGQVFWACLDRIKSCVYSFSRVLLFSNFDGFPFLNVVDAEAKLPTPVAMKSEDWDENASTVNGIEGAENSEPIDKSSVGVCLTEKCNEWTNGITVEAREKTTKIVSIEAALDESENKKLEQNVNVQTSSSFLTSLQIRKMAEMRYSVAAHTKVEVEEMHDMRGLRQHQIMWWMAISRAIGFDSLIVVIHLKNWEVDCMLIPSGQYMESLPILVPRRVLIRVYCLSNKMMEMMKTSICKLGSLLLMIQPGVIVDSLSWIQSYTIKLLFSGMVEGATHKFKFIKNFWGHFVPVIWFLHYVDAYSPAFELSLLVLVFNNGKFSWVYVRKINVFFLESDNFYALVLESRGVEFEGLPNWGNSERSRINVKTRNDQQIVPVLHDYFVLKSQHFAIYREVRRYQFLVSFERNGSKGSSGHFYWENGCLRGFGRLEATGYTSNLSEVSYEDSSLEFVLEEKILHVPFDPGGNYLRATDYRYSLPQPDLYEERQISPYIEERDRITNL